MLRLIEEVGGRITLGDDAALSFDGPEPRRYGLAAATPALRATLVARLRTRPG